MDIHSCHSVSRMPLLPFSNAWTIYLKLMKKETELLGDVIMTELSNSQKFKGNKIVFGLCGSYRKFKPNLAKISKHMTEKLKNEKL